jgi:hypothetical protein
MVRIANVPRNFSEALCGNAVLNGIGIEMMVVRFRGDEDEHVVAERRQKEVFDVRKAAAKDFHSWACAASPVRLFGRVKSV